MVNFLLGFGFGTVIGGGLLMITYLLLLNRTAKSYPDIDGPERDYWSAPDSAYIPVKNAPPDLR